MDPNSLRHHRRSIDRVWPPALEVRLARLSIDEGSSAVAPHVIFPVAPPVGYGESDGCCGPGLPDIPDDEDLGEEQEGCSPGSMESSTDLSRRGSLAMLTAPTVLELDAAHQHQHGQQSHVHIKYSNQQHPHSQRQHHERGQHYTNHNGNTADSDVGKSNNHDITCTHGEGHHATHQHSLHVQTAKPPIYVSGSLMMDTNEFGEDLFNTDTNSPAASFHFERFSLSLPEMQSGVSNKNGDDSTLNTGPLTPILPLASSPYRRHGGPLSAPSSKATSRASSPLARSRTPLQEKSLSANNIQQPVANRPTSPGLLHLLQPLDPTNSKSILNNLYSSHEDEARPRSPVPAVMDMMTLMDDEQDRWKSPTLSALASRSSSLTSSPGTKSPSGVDSLPSTLVARLHRQRRRQMQHTRHGHGGTGGVNPELSEVPLIEARGEVSLQEIWRMEDEERLDRMLNDAGDENKDPHGNQENILETASSDMAGSGHLRKGEQHAHEEARLIQQVINHAQ
ncbi:hypothetical protein CPB97_007062 [Podila verticillata]|nr:hypothetical protein CPB97_007062 [Podila verticillata]